MHLNSNRKEEIREKLQKESERGREDKDQSGQGSNVCLMYKTIINRHIIFHSVCVCVRVRVVDMDMYHAVYVVHGIQLFCVC